MNILVPHTWLFEHLETEAIPEDIQRCLSLCGPSVERIETIEGEPVYDIEVTTNRVDSASVRGIAREAATILPEFGINATLKPLKVESAPSSLPKLETMLAFQNDPKLCKRILAVVLEVSVKPSPEWMQKRLIQVGQRPLNNLIDMTNYLMWELGHPTHVFDFDKFTQKKLIVREAKAGETIITLDNKTHQTVGGEVVFDDGTGTIIDMPGIMGTANTMVDENTKRVMFFIDSVVAEKIRFTSMTHAIRSQAAVLNEKNVDPSLGDEVILSAIQLLAQIADAQPITQIYDTWPVKPAPQSISLSEVLITTYLGVTISTQKVLRILRSLGCEAGFNSNDASYTVTPPSFRSFDLQIPQDIIEEIARIYGYHNLPSTLMPTPIPEVDTNINHRLEMKIKTYLADLGLREVYTYSLVSKKQAEASQISLDEHIHLKNPLNEDLAYLRRTIIPSHHEVFAINKAYHKSSIFELANVYELPQEDEPSLPTETLQLVLSSTESYSFLKGIVEALCKKLRIKVRFELADSLQNENGTFISTKTAVIKSGGQVVGMLGKTVFGFFSAQLNYVAIRDLYQPYPAYQPIPNTSLIIEDLTFTLPEKTPIGSVLEFIEQVNPKIKKVELKDIFQQNYTFTISYQDPSEQLTDKSIAPIRERIVLRLQENFKATLVGSLLN